MTEDKYQPIDCNAYDVYEIAIMHHSSLEIEWLDEQGVSHHQRVKPLNLEINNKAEYLVAMTELDHPASVRKIRLDRILSATEKGPG